MKTGKKDVIQFLVWMRNGFAFVTAWFLILSVIYSRSVGVESIATDSLLKLMLFVAGGVLFFSLVFTRVLFKKQSFQWRLTCFMVLISGYECLVFYATGFWQAGGTPWEWLVFVGLVLILYLLCIGIYHVYSRKQGALYTQALQNYQKKRSAENKA